MTRETLHKVRFGAPGTLAFVGWLSLSLPAKDFLNRLADLKLEVHGLGGAAVLILSAVYFLGDARSQLSLRFSWRPIVEQIEDELLRVVGTKTALSSCARQWLRERGRLVGIFFALADNDQSLKAKQSGIYLNGAVLTTVVDLGVVSWVTAMLHLFAAVFTQEWAHLAWAAALLAVWISCEALLLPVAMRRHLKRSGEQLEVIASLHAQDLLNKVQTVLQGMPSVSAAEARGSDRSHSS